MTNPTIPSDSEVFMGHANASEGRTCAQCGSHIPVLNPAEMPSNATLLSGMMAVAVPMAIAELQRCPWETVARVVGEAASTLASQGDILQFKSKKKGETAAVFASTARGLAALSFAPGGASFLGEHWCAEHPDAPARSRSTGDRGR